MKHSMWKIWIVLICIGITVESRTMNADASTSNASLWTLDSTGKAVAFKSYDPGQDGWKATSYERYADSTAKLLWTKDNAASLWTINASGTVTGTKTYSPGATGWTATSYTYNPTTGVGKMLWTHTSSKASLWTISSSGGLTFKGYAPGASGWTATSYELYSDGTAKLLWTKDNSASLWTLKADGSVSAFKSFSPGQTGWTATSYTMDFSTKYAKMLWKKGQIASLWTINPSEAIIAFSSYNPGVTGWNAESYQSPGGISTPTSKTSSAQVQTVVVKKAGSGSGTLTSGTTVCDATCTTLTVTYVAGGQIALQVTPSAGSVFTGWQAADGTMLDDIYYANPGDTVFAVFELQ